MNARQFGISFTDHLISHQEELMYTGFFVSGMISKIYSQVKFFKNQGTKKKKKKNPRYRTVFILCYHLCEREKITCVFTSFYKIYFQKDSRKLAMLLITGSIGK